MNYAQDSFSGKKEEFMQVKRRLIYNQSDFQKCLLELFKINNNAFGVFKQEKK